VKIALVARTSTARALLATRVSRSGKASRAAYEHRGAAALASGKVQPHKPAQSSSEAAPTALRRRAAGGGSRGNASLPAARPLARAC